MRVLAITKIFPNALDPHYAPYNRQQFAELARRCDLHVLATIPSFPGARWARRWSAIGKLTAVPDQETISGIQVRHPRTWFVPKLPGLSLPLYVASLARAVLPMRGLIDAVFATWAYPDGCAAVALAEALGVPAVVKVHGSDINCVSALRGPRYWMKRWLPRASRVIAVSRALGGRLAELGVPRDRIEVVLNGVDTSVFFPRDRQACRAALGLPEERKLIVYVGRVTREKGVLDLLEAFDRIAPVRPDVDLAIVGVGGASGACERARERHPGRVWLAGNQSLDGVAAWLGASDVHTLPSWNEGTPNCVLEALASGRRVVATRVGGVPDLVDLPELGQLVQARSPGALAQALVQSIDVRYDPAQVVAASAATSWHQNGERVFDLLRSAVREKTAMSSRASAEPARGSRPSLSEGG